MIRVHDLSVHLGSFSLRNIRFEVPSQGYGVLMGKTGTGKTTILESICGLRQIQKGTIELAGKEVTHMKPAERGIGFVPQDGALFSTMSIWEHLAFSLRIRKVAHAEIKRRVEELAELLGIGHILKRSPQGLSGGEYHRVALGRALASKPSVLCMDEPLSALDDETKDGLCELLRSLRRQTGVTTLHITHSLQEAKALATRIYLLRDGRIRDFAPEEMSNLDGGKSQPPFASPAQGESFEASSRG